MLWVKLQAIPAQAQLQLWVPASKLVRLASAVHTQPVKTLQVQEIKMSGRLVVRSQPVLSVLQPVMQMMIVMQDLFQQLLVVPLQVLPQKSKMRGSVVRTTSRQH